ncbi:hypothetical protein [Paenibacillus sp. MBLB4367]|uniref:hypothetical protein n=1 Tax=Paenibacillus sp. MBLB4367 TaxID=3384767 RepID=UPI0039083610
MKRDKFYVIGRLATTIVSAILFCVLLAVYYQVQTPERQEGTVYWSFSSLIILYLIYSGPVYVIGGLPYSFFADAMADKMKHFLLVFAVKLLLYAGGGFAIAFLFGAIIGGSGAAVEDIAGFSLLGVIAALLFMHVSLLADWLAHRLRVAAQARDGH